jgi:DNA (cytosine-5)-methyltransferase 1
MKRDFLSLPLDLGNELIIDNFAGGGGTSTGLEAAFGRPVDIAINHDPEALAMHAINHPHTKHLCESVWDVDPIKVTGNQPVGLVWLSPDCKHFSKAKGGKPVEKKIRGLAWVTLRWAATCKPRVIMLENVEEFKTWGPLLIAEDGTAKPDPAKKGKTFASFVRQLEAHGYTVDHRELRASDHNTPTIRKRFFLVARRDGLPILWPEATNGAPTSFGVMAGKLAPYRTAAECIDWSIPCPSIFDRKKPLAEATLRRIAKGIMRYVVESASPFIVGQGGPVYAGKPVSTEQPFGTLTTENHRAVVVPHLAAAMVQTGYGEREGQAPRALDIEKPLGTIVGEGKAALVTAFLNEHANASHQRVMPADEPLRTQCAQVKGGHFSLVSAVLTGVGGRAGQSRPRSVDEPTATATSKADAALITAYLVDAAHADISPSGVKRWGQGHKDIEAPIGTIAASGNQALVTAFMAQHNKERSGVKAGRSVDAPISTLTASGSQQSLVTAHITKFRTGSTGSELTDPMPTITAGPKENPAGAPHALGIVSAHIQRDMGQSVGHAADSPLGTTTAGGGGKSALVVSHLTHFYSSNTRGGQGDPREPMKTITATGQHHAEVRAFLLSYYGSESETDSPGKPLRTVTSRERFGLVTIQGQDYEIVDIGLRMLAPAELYRAQGFPAEYIIHEIPDPALLFVDGHQTTADPLSLPRVPLTKSAQVRMCGNSVCPPLSEALIRANFTHEREIVRAA